MLEFKTGDILHSGAFTLVNPVNTQGVMGAGLAKVIKEAFPACFPPYEQACKRGLLDVGSILVTSAHASYDNIETPFWIAHLPTKKRWRDPSLLIYVDEGLWALKHILLERKHVKGNIDIAVSVAIPALGCGLGGLDWKDVQPLFEKYLADIPSSHIMVFSPLEG